MKRNSRFLALLLALLILLTLPVAFAEDSVEVGTAQDYVDLLTAAETYEIPETVVFTAAGPFMPAVNVGGGVLRAPANQTGEDENGIVTSKQVTANEDGSYTITMEAYATGKVTTTTKINPVDIVLVLDQSGSMAYNFNGNETSDNSSRRQYAMKNAVNNFIDAVNQKYDAANSDHRMAIVTFGSSASTLQGWTYVDAGGKGTLQNSINGLPNSPSGATNVGEGMQQAETLMGSGYNYTGSNKTRQKVVIVFTDGVPTKSGDGRFNVDLANTALTAAKSLKTSGATVYSIGIFTGANPNELYGKCDGNVGDRWGSTKFIYNGDVADIDMPAGNRFLNYLSSNFYDASEIGLESTDWWFFASHKGWKITKNFTRTNTGYYLTAANANDLNNIFTTISQNIQTADIDLGSETVLKDVVTPYFDLPQNVSDVKLYTAFANADGTFAARTSADASVKASIDADSRTVSVTGFDYSANFVSDRQKEDGTYGKKLIVEFTIMPKDGFLGGNQVPTNDWQNSGVYDKDGNPVERFASEDSTPKVDVPIEDVVVKAQDKDVYLLGSLTTDQLLEKSTVNDNQLEDWQKAFVNIEVEATTTGTLTEDTTYTLTATLTPKYEGVQKAKTVTGNEARINVHKPTLTYRDSAINLGDTADYADNKVGNVVWKHGDESIVPELIYGTEPELTLTYTPAAAAFKQDTNVAVNVKIGDSDVTQYTTFIRKACEDCEHTVDTVVMDNIHFAVHVKDFDLTIHVTGCDSIDENQTYLFTVTDSEGMTLTVSVTGNNSITIKGLSAGKDYTVTQDTAWSWRYTPDQASKAVDNVKDGKAELTFANTRTAEKWLDGNAGKDNRW